MSKIKAIRMHDFSMGHTVTGHEGKCRHLHGHNYRAIFHVEADKLDTLGRVMDFSVIKEHLCEWLEENWDHKFVISKDDKRVNSLKELDPNSVVVVDFNPTAENLADYLLNVIGPKQLKGTGVLLSRVELEETRKCSVDVTLKE